MVELFQRKIFACLSYIRILQWLRFFFRFSSLKSMFIFPSLKLTTQYSIIFFYIFKCGLHYLAMVELFQRKIFACSSYIRILQWLRFFFRFSSLKSMFFFPSLKLTTQYSIIFYYIFKCGFHYLAVVKLFQRKIFACLSYIRILQWLRFIFFRFSSLKSMFIFPKLKLTTQYSIIFLNAGFNISPWLSFFNVKFLHV